MPAATPAPAIFGGPKPSTKNMTDRHFVTRERARKDMESLGVLMTDGHFDYGNGFHGRVYLNAHQLFRHPSTIWRLAQDLLDVIPSDLQLKTEVVAGPATGGALLAHTIAGLLDGRRSLSHPPCAFAPFQYDNGRRRAAAVLRRVDARPPRPARRRRPQHRQDARALRRAGARGRRRGAGDGADLRSPRVGRRPRRAQHRPDRLPGPRELPGRPVPPVPGRNVPFDVTLRVVPTSESLRS